MGEPPPSEPEPASEESPSEPDPTIEHDIPTQGDSPGNTLAGQVLPSECINRFLRVFGDYWTVFKPILAIVEALEQRLPAEILNEIRALFDHLARCFKNDSTPHSVERNIDKARGHLKRAILDCYKHIIIFYHDEVEQLLNHSQNVDYTLIDNGAFYPELIRLRTEAREKLIAAKETEGSVDEDNPLYAYKTAHDAYSILHEHVIDNLRGIQWAQGRSRPSFLGRIARRTK